jgi:hypothetical protein
MKKFGGSFKFSSPFTVGAEICWWWRWYQPRGVPTTGSRKTWLLLIGP